MPATGVEESYELFRDDMRDAALFDSQDDYCLPHFHSSIELVYVAEGELGAILDGQTLSVPAGHVLLTSSYAVHTYYTEPKRHNRVLVIIIPLSCVPSLAKALGSQRFAAPVYDARADREITALFPLMYEGWENYSGETRDGFSHALLGLLVSRVGLIPQPSSRQSGVMREVLRYLQLNFQQPLHMDALARRFGYSKSRFSRLFHDHLGCSMNEYVSALRCRQAARMLLESDMTMLDIAMGAGFECLRTFYRAFKSCYGMTPTQYIREPLIYSSHA